MRKQRFVPGTDVPFVLANGRGKARIRRFRALRDRMRASPDLDTPRFDIDSDKNRNMRIAAMVTAPDDVFAEIMENRRILREEWGRLEEDALALEAQVIRGLLRAQQGRSNAGNKRRKVTPESVRKVVEETIETWPLGRQLPRMQAYEIAARKLKVSVRTVRKYACNKRAD